MRKKYVFYFASLVLSAALQQMWSQSQQHVWFLKDQNIDFTQGSNPVISPIQNQFGTSPNEDLPETGNGIHDINGERILSVNNSEVYSRYGYIGTLDHFEYAAFDPWIVPKPGSSCQYYIFYSSVHPNADLQNPTYCGISSMSTNYFYAEVDLSANGGLGQISNNGQELDVCTNYLQSLPMTVSTLYQNNTRILFKLSNVPGIGRVIKRFEISSSGITQLASIILPSSIANVESLEIELSFDRSKLAFANKDGHKVFVVHLDNSGGINQGLGNLSSGISSYSIPNATNLTGIEFNPNGNELLVGSLGAGLFVLDFQNNNSQLLSNSNILSYSCLELGYSLTNHAIYAVSNSNQLTSVSFSNSLIFSNIVPNGNVSPYINPNTFSPVISHLPPQIDGEDYVAQFQNQPVECCVASNKFDALQLTISNDQSWNGSQNPVINSSSINIMNELRIASGKTLQLLNVTLAFGNTGKIIIEPGAKLIVNSSTLTSFDCEGLMWEGIELQGNANSTQNTSSQGQLIINNSTIENAHQGVIVYGMNGNQIDWSKTGGKITASNATFKNNWKDVAFLSYSFPNTSKFSESHFITTQNLKNGTFPGWHVSMYDVNGVIFEGCDFVNSNPSLNIFNRGSGIKSIDSKFTVTGLCLPAQPSSGPCQNLIQSSFENIDFGIDATGSNQNQTIEISYSNFNEIIQGIQLTGTRNSKIFENTINLTSSLDPNQPAIGIYLISCEKHAVENNTLYGQGHLSVAWGIIIDNSNLGGLSKVTNLVYRNELHDLTYGITSLHENAELIQNGGVTSVVPGTGLVFKCNRFYNGDISDITATGPVAINQGVCNNLLHDPSNNVFSNPPTSQADIWYTQNQFPMRYFYDYSTNPIVRTEPQNNLYNPVNTTLFACNNSFNYSESCPSKNYPFGTSTLIDLKDDYLTEIQHYNDSIDGGNKGFLIQAIDNEDPNIVFALLSPLSGRLSEEVLIALINEAPRIPYGVANDILVQNTPLSEKVKLEISISTFPVYYQSLLLSIPGISPFDQIISELSHYEHEVSLLENEIFHKIMEDSTIINKLEAITNLILIDLSEEERLRFLIEFNISLQQQSISDSLHSIYTSTYNNAVYASFQSLLIEKMNQPGKLLGSLSDTNVSNQLVNLITTNPDSREAKIANKLFEFILTQDAYSNIDHINYVKSMNILVEAMKQKSKHTLEVFPNPSSDIISFNLGLVDNDEATVEILSLEGKPIFKAKMSAQNTFIDVKTFATGNYLIQVTYQNGFKLKTHFSKI
jgi:hypothetical protein